MDDSTEGAVVDRFHPNRPRVVPVPTYECEVCGKSVTIHEAVVHKVLMPHLGEGMPALACAADHHWACSDEHAEVVFLRCYNEHMKPAVALLRKLLAEQALPREDEFGEDVVPDSALEDAPLNPDGSGASWGRGSKQP